MTASGVVLSVALGLPRSPTYDYRAPASVPAGVRVRVPFGRSLRIGIVLGEAIDGGFDPERLRSIDAVLDVEPIYTPELWRTLHFAARYYAHPLGEWLLGALPAPLREGRAAEPERWWVAAPDAKARGPLGRRLVEAARAPIDESALKALADDGGAALRRLLRAGQLVPASPPANASPASARASASAVALTSEQLAAVDALATAGSGFKAWLLQGVTGSGKTEVYLAAIERALAAGGQCLVLLPEIALAPQALERYRARLGAGVFAYHSGLAEGERARTWLAAREGRARVVIGTRSAVFVPLPRAGLIIVDEEHDGAYKQQEGPRYHARDLALARARALDVPIVLGSATPSLESLAGVEAGRLARLRLSRRARGAAPPAVRVVDLRGQRLVDGLGQEALAALDACVARGEQALVFRNRRGYAPVLLCRACGWHPACPRCDRPLTLHRTAQRLRCHHCGRDQAAPKACPECAGGPLAPTGIGTERLEDALSARHPGIPVLRVDRDSMRRRNAFGALLTQLAAPGPAILVGTQMLAKGHDLPRLALAVLVDVDGGLYAADFRAAERLAQLVVQVAGRTGRAERRGEVLLQTHRPDHPLLRGLITGGYDAVAAKELEQRRALRLPPFARWALLRAESATPTAALAFLAAAATALGPAPGVDVLGPMPAPMPRRAGMHRFQMLLESAHRAPLQAVLGDWRLALEALPEARRVRFVLDVDPIDLD